MDETSTVEPEATPKQSGYGALIILCTVVVLIVIAGGGLALRNELFAFAGQQAKLQADAREKLAARIDALEGASTAAKPDDAAMAALNTKLTETATQLDALSTRIEALEKKAQAAPAPVAAAAPAPAAPTVVATPAAPAPSNELSALKLAALSGQNFSAELAAWNKRHPETAKQTAILSLFAESGIPSEAAMNQQLREAIDAAVQSKKIDDVSVIGKINTHLAGLVSIKKTSDASPYATLRSDALKDDLPTLIRSVEALDEPTRAPLASWLKTAQNRADALAALNNLDHQGGQE